MLRPALAAALVLSTFACGQGAPETANSGGSEDGLTGVGSVAGSGNWGAATTCKALPTGLPALKSPMLVISLDGLTLHLWDRQGTFDKVYPIGPGAIENGVSLTPVGHYTTGPADATAGAQDDGTKVGSSPWSWWYRCKIWWTDPVTKQITPVYGGLPLIRLTVPGLAYAIHGPVDSFGAANGGALRRAYVSHGCIRTRAEDIVELYVLLHGHGHVPVTIQRAVERDPAGKSVDLSPRFIGSECDSAADCGFAGALCQANAYGHSFCTVACTGSCADRTGEIATACIPDGKGAGMCVRQASLLNNFCRSDESFRYAPQTTRFGRPSQVDVCAPGSSGFVGDPCLSSSDCAAGRTCERKGRGPGLCTQGCTSSCPTEHGLGATCVAGRCLRSCDVQDACGTSTATTCQRAGAASACVP